MNDEYNTPEQLQEEKEILEREVLDRLRMRDTMSTPGFVYFVSTLTELAGHHIDTFQGNVEESLILQGRRSLYMDFLAVLDECDATYYPRLLLKIAEEKENDRDTHRNSNHDSN